MTIANVTLNNTFDEWRVITNQLIVQSNEIIAISSRAYDNVNTVNVIAVSAYDYVNTVNVIAVSAYDYVNTVNVIAVSAYDASNTVYDFANTVYDFANTVYDSSNAVYDFANTVETIAIAAFDVANSALPNTSGVSFSGDLYFPTGNIAVGRSTASYTLDINGTINASALLINGATLSSGATLIEDAANSTRYLTFADSTSGTFIQANVSTSLIYNPSTGTLSSTIFNSTSDAERKTNIQTIDNALDTVSMLRGVRFNWKDTGNPSYGLVAQEVEKYIPELVDTNESGSKTLNYDAIIGFLVEAIKELKKNG